MSKRWRSYHLSIISIGFVAVTIGMFVWINVIEDIPILSWFVLLSALTFTAIIVALIILRIKHKDIWYSQIRLTTTESEDFIERLEEALRNAGLEPVPRAGKLPYPIWRTIDLKGGLNLSLAGQQGWYEMSVGPVRKATRQDVRRVEQVIDKALEGIEG